jgi:hypothetical protein
MYYLGTYNRLGVHVYASPREVIRAARTKLKHQALRDREYRKSRHEFYRAMLKFHKKARKLVTNWRL